MNQSFHDLDNEIELFLIEHKDELISDWMRLIRIPSVRGNPTKGAPYGKECADALRLSADLFSSYGFTVTTNEEDGYALSRYGNGKAVLGLFSHSDVVPTSDGWVYTSPFEPKKIDGFMIGRGCNDNKSGVIASLYAMRAIRELNLNLSSTLQSFVGSSEETGMEDIKAFANKETMPSLSLIPDADFPCSLGEKGILRLWVECDTPMIMLRDLFGGEAFNVVLDRATAIINCTDYIKNEFSNNKSKTASIQFEETEEGLQISAFGIAKHAAYPNGGVNAAAKLAEYLLSQQLLPQSDRSCLEAIRDFIAEFDGKAMEINHTDPDFGALSCVNGMVRMKDQKVQISLDVRYGTSLDPTVLEEKIERAWKNRGWHIISMNNEPGFSAPKNSPVPRIITDLSNTISDKKYEPYRMSGGTYARYLKNAFSIGTSLAHSKDCAALDFPAGHGGVHERDEAINVDSLLRAIKLLVHAILQCDKVIS